MCTLAAFYITLKQGGDSPDALVKAQTVAFVTLVMAQLIHVFDCRSSRSIFHRNPLQNVWLVLAVVSSLLLMLPVLYVEQLQPIFKTVPLGGLDWLLVLVFAGIPTFLMGIGSVMSGSSRRKRVSYGGGPKPIRPAAR
ncbi:P-type HAD superfamily ATPase [Mycobacterium tuberculosis]|nr:P-type HAD superfamily ATPase [Mycobacterium tuberculosis]